MTVGRHWGGSFPWLSVLGSVLQPITENRHSWTENKQKRCFPQLWFPKSEKPFQTAMQLKVTEQNLVCRQKYPFLLKPKPLLLYRQKCFKNLVCETALSWFPSTWFLPEGKEGASKWQTWEVREAASIKMWSSKRCSVHTCLAHFCLTLNFSSLWASSPSLLSVLPDNCAKDFCLAPLLVAPDEVLKLRKGPGIFLHKTFAWSERFWLTHCDWCRVLFCARMALQTWQAASLGLVSTPPKNPINSDMRSDEMLVKNRRGFLN